MANSFLEYYRFNTKIALDQTVLMRIEKKSGDNALERPRGITSAYATQAVRPYQQQVQST